MNKFILIICFISLISCSEKTISEQEPNLRFQGPFQLELGEIGLSSLLMRTYKITGINNEDGFLVYNNYYDRVDSLFFQDETGFATKGELIDKQGPTGIPNFNWFDASVFGFIFYDRNAIYLQSEDDVVKVDFLKNPSFDGTNLKQIVHNFSFNQFSDFYDNRESSLLLFKDFLNEEYSAYAFDHMNFNLKELDFHFDHNLLGKHTLFVEKNNGKVYWPNTPYLTKVDNARFLISYPFASKIHLEDISKNTSKEIQVKTSAYPDEKEVSLSDSDGTSFDMEGIGDKWSDDVLFGPMYLLENGDYVRIVKGPVQLNSGFMIYLEIFDSDFYKKNELSLDEYSSDLDIFHLVLGNRIILKAKNQLSEDLLNYYVLDFSQEK